MTKEHQLNFPKLYFCHVPLISNTIYFLLMTIGQYMSNSSHALKFLSDKELRNCRIIGINIMLLTYLLR